jgi:bidirectional [NiFe] hydrogenase diaphorase subunit
MAIVTLTIDDEQLSAKDDDRCSDARQHKIEIPTLHLTASPMSGLPPLPRGSGMDQTRARVPPPLEGMVVHTSTERLKKYRKMIVGLLASEGNHQCAVCMVNNHCELQNLAYDVGLLYVGVPYLYPSKHIDASHESFIIDHNRCVLCTRCVRVCHEVKAHTCGTRGRHRLPSLSDLNQPRGQSKAVPPASVVLPDRRPREEGGAWPKWKSYRITKYIVTARRRRVDHRGH